MDNKNVIRLLILEHSVNQAETLAGMLRNAGFAVRYQYVKNSDELQGVINEQPWDMLLASHQVDSFTQALAAIKKSGKDIPCIVYDSNRTDIVAVELIHAGATDFVSDKVDDYLLLVIKRELANLQGRHAHRHCKTLYHESEKRNRVLLNSSRDSIAYIHEGMHIYANQSYQDIFGYNDQEELESVPIMDLIAAEDQQSFKDVLRSISNDAPPEDALEYQAMREDGEIFTATMEFSRASIEGEACTQVMIHRKSHNKELEKEIQQLRQQDLLTGLCNHQYFMEQVQDTVDRVANGEELCALLYIELNNFKKIKDTLGIAESDRVLTDIADFLRETAPDKAVIARYGGTIFSILLCGKLHAQAEELAERIRHGLANKIFEAEGKSAATTCSIGIARISETSENAKRSLFQSESACSIARNQGGNTVHIFSEEDELANLEADKKIFTLLQLALKNNRFQLQYQPIVSLHAEPGERYEVLLRMLDQNNNIIMPGEFLDTARDNSLMTEIDRWVIKNAAKAILDKRKIGKDIQFFIKISVESICDPSILAWVSKLLQAARLHGNSLVFELSEPDVRNNLKVAKIFSSGLKQLHCNLALDHVGKNNTEFSYLKHLDISYLKIDGSHIQNIANEESQELIKQITDLGRNNGFLTIAEHVQDPGCLAVLWQHGVNFIQGYYLQHPENNLDYDFTSSD